MFSQVHYPKTNPPLAIFNFLKTVSDRSMVFELNFPSMNIKKARASKGPGACPQGLTQLGNSPVTEVHPQNSWTFGFCLKTGSYVAQARLQHAV